jgi:hypothetical protein
MPPKLILCVCDSATYLVAMNLGLFLESEKVGSANFWSFLNSCENWRLVLLISSWCDVIASLFKYSTLPEMQLLNLFFLKPNSVLIIFDTAF